MAGRVRFTMGEFNEVTPCAFSQQANGRCLRWAGDLPRSRALLRRFGPMRWVSSHALPKGGGQG